MTNLFNMTFNANFKNANIDVKTGIRYGVINANKVYTDYIFGSGLSVCYIEALCDYLKEEFDYDAKEVFVDPSEYEYVYNYYTDLMDHIVGLDHEVINGKEFYLDEITDSLAYTLEEKEFLFLEDGLALQYNLDCNTIMVLKSKETGYFNLCSPCYPNAVHLDDVSNEDEGYLGYTLPYDWWLED